MDSTTRPAPRFWLDFGPLLLFFVANKLWGILAATAVLIPATLIAIGLSWKLERRVSRAALFGAACVLVFGGLTLLFRDAEFIQIKVTVINVLLAAVLGAGLLRGKSLLRYLLGDAFRLSDEGWRLLTLRFALFFLCLAGLNEVARRVLSTDAWVNFKVFGVLGLTLVFSLAQARLLEKHTPEEPAS